MTTTYLHPDMGAFTSKLTEMGWKEIMQRHCDFTRVFTRFGDAIVIDLPEGEVYEAVEVHFGQKITTAQLVELGFPL